MTQSAKQWVYFGTYTHHNGESRPEGIFLYEFDPASGTLERLRAQPTFANPGFLAVTPDRRFLYATNEVGEFQGQPGGGVSAYARDPFTGALTFLNWQSTFGADPCYVSIDSAGKWVFVSNYSGGSVAVYPIGRDGRLGQPTSFVQHQGNSGVDAGRQDAPHAHSILPDPSGRYVLVADLGKDQVVLYNFDRAGGRLTPHDPRAIKLAPGAGPRHMGFHPGGSYFYVVSELNSTVTVYAFDAATGSFAELQVIEALPHRTPGIEMAADLHVAPSGKTLYTSNRGYSTGNDTISVFSIEPGSGRLALLEIVPTGGRTPRNFSLDLTGQYLLVAHQDSSTVVTFRIDPATGRITPTGEVTEIPSPVCVCFVPIA